jgi:hypothetical protein
VGFVSNVVFATNADAIDPLVLRHIGILFCYSALNQPR